MKSTALSVLIILFSVIIQAQSFDIIWETGQVLKTPESVLFDAERNQVYVSNINGKPLDKDNNGFISILEIDGTIKNLKWVIGMHAPKGMTIVGNLLYVTDIDRFHIINIDEGRIIKTVPVKNAVFLNDMAADEMGGVYISDMSKNQILKYFNDTVTIWMEGDLINTPNGLSFFKGALLVGTKNSLLRVNIAEQKAKVIVEETGPIDGLIPLGGGKFVISDWSGKVMKISTNEKIVMGNTTDQNIQAADLGYLPEEKLILIPTFFDNRVVAHKLP